MSMVIIIAVVAICCLLALSGGVGIWYYMKKKNEEAEKPAATPPTNTPPPGPDIVRNSNLSLYYDLTNPASYSGTGMTISDLSGKQNHLVLPPKLKVENSSLTGVLDGTYSTATTDLELDFGGEKKLTLEGWFKFKQAATNAPFYSVIGFRTAEVAWHGVRFDNRNRAVRGTLVHKDGEAPSMTEERLSSDFTDVWMHIVWVLEETKHVLYINGVRQSEAPKIALTWTPGRLALANMHDVLRVRVLRLYHNYCLTEEEIKRHYNLESARIRAVA